jgi:hypothetical protein
MYCKGNMSLIKCPKCQDTFDGEIYPECPSCLSVLWNNTPGFVRQKHDPYQLPFPMSCFRSVLSHDIVDNLQEFTGSAAHMGMWYYSIRHKEYCHVTAFPCHTIPGSAVFEGDPMPTIALNGLMVAKAGSDPHAYCVDISEFQADLAAGEYTNIPRCSQKDCGNLAIPGSDKCSEHLNSG